MQRVGRPFGYSLREGEARFTRVTFPTDGFSVSDGLFHAGHQGVDGEVVETVPFPIVRHFQYELGEEWVMGKTGQGFVGIG